jgi:two-component system response regulator TctD
MDVLLVEDDLSLVQALGRALAARGCALVSCRDGLEALALCQRRRFDAVVLDLSLPDLDGLEVLARMRGRDDATPVLILTARGAVGERVTGLNAGADDYLAKPFDLDELEARLRALVRRRQGEGDLRCGLLRLDRSGPACWVDERPLDLPAREAALLRALMLQAGHAVAREHLHHAVFPGGDPVAGSGGPQADALDVVVHRLRKRLAAAAVEIVTLRGVGYLLCEDTQALVKGPGA